MDEVIMSVDILEKEQQHLNSHPPYPSEDIKERLKSISSSNVTVEENVDDTPKM